MKLLRKLLANVDDGFDDTLLHRFLKGFVTLAEDEVEFLVVTTHIAQPIIKEEDVEELSEQTNCRLPFLKYLSPLIHSLIEHSHHCQEVCWPALIICIAE